MKTKKEIREAIDALNEILDSLSRGKKVMFLGHMNTLFLVLEDLKQEAKD